MSWCSCHEDTSATMQLVSSAMKEASALLADTTKPPFRCQAIACLLDDVVGQGRDGRQGSGDHESAATLQSNGGGGRLDHHGAALDAQLERHARLDTCLPPEVARDDEASGLIDGRFH